MIPFIRETLPLIDRSVRRRLGLSVVLAVFLAGLEAAGLLLILPLLEILTIDQAGELTGPAHMFEDALGDVTRIELAGVLAGIVFTTFVVKGALALVYLRWSIGTVLTAEAATAAELLRAYLGAPYIWHLRQSSSDLQSRIQDAVRRVFGEALVAVVGAASDIIIMSGIGVVLLAVQPRATLIAAVYFAAVAMGYQRLIHGRAQAAGTAIVRDTGKAYQVVQQSINAVKTVQTGHHEDFFVTQYTAARERTARNLRTLMLLYQAPRYYLEIALIAGVGLMALVLFSTEPTSDAVAGLGLFLAAGFRVLPSLNRTLVARGAAQSALSSSQRLVRDLEDLRTLPTTVDRPPTHPETPVGPGLRLRLTDVSFSYGERSEPVIQNVTLDIEPGTSVAFVGPSGAGKTTLVDLMLGLLDPTQGSVQVDDVELSAVRAHWQRTVGYVPQDSLVIDDSLRANIAFGVEPDDVDEDAVARAVRQAQLVELVSALPDGLETRLNERGTRLSGGQRQRVGIARALYSDPRLLVLDEATSSLDSHTEALITDTIDALAGELTVVTVTHRLATVKRCDRIHVMDRGLIVATGDFVQLTASSPIFRRLLQAAGASSRRTVPEPH